MSAPVKELGCSSLRDSLFDGLRAYLQRQDKLSSQLQTAGPIIENQIREFWGDRLTTQARARLSGEILDFYRMLISKNLNTRDLGAVGMGDKSRPGMRKLQAEITEHLEHIQQLVQSAGLSCAIQTQASEKVAPRASAPSVVFGARKAFATAYQSCQSLSLPPMTRSTPDTEGVEETGNYPGSWTGKFYAITDHEALNRTHYYIKNYKPAPGCMDVKKYSMIYDFGGKPWTTSDPESSLNFWKNNSDGSPGLGIDCSGYVFTSIAAAGLRLKANKRLKAAEVEDYPASMYINPPDNGFSCLKKPPMGKSGTLKAGDIIASKYHVALIERVGADPFAIKKYSDCSQITYRDFDFVIAQSSPEHGVIGINRYSAKEYLDPFTKFIFRGGLEEYAREACKAYQDNGDTVVDSSSFGVSRHKLTPECLQNEIKLESQSCIESCTELYE